MLGGGEVNPATVMLWALALVVDLLPRMTFSFRIPGLKRTSKTLVISHVDREVVQWFDDLAAQVGGRAAALSFLRAAHEAHLRNHDDPYQD